MLYTETGMTFIIPESPYNELTVAGLPGPQFMNPQLFIRVNLKSIGHCFKISLIMCRCKWGSCGNTCKACTELFISEWHFIGPIKQGQVEHCQSLWNLKGALTGQEDTTQASQNLQEYLSTLSVRLPACSLQKESSHFEKWDLKLESWSQQFQGQKQRKTLKGPTV